MEGGQSGFDSNHAIAATMSLSGNQSTFGGGQGVLNQSGYISPEYPTGSVGAYVGPSSRHSIIPGIVVQAQDVQLAQSNWKPPQGSGDGLLSEIQNDSQMPGGPQDQRHDIVAGNSYGGGQELVTEATTTRASTRKGDGSRKKSRKTALSEEELNGQKARGRPRLDTRDESASDVSIARPARSIYKVLH